MPAHAAVVLLLTSHHLGWMATAMLQGPHSRLGPQPAEPLPDSWVELNGIRPVLASSKQSPGGAAASSQQSEPPTFFEQDHATSTSGYTREPYPVALAAMQVVQKTAVAQDRAPQLPVTLPHRLNQSIMSFLSLSPAKEAPSSERQEPKSTPKHLERPGAAKAKSNATRLANSVETPQQRQIDNNIGAIRARVEKLENAMRFISDSSRSCDDVMNSANKEESCSDRQERCGDAFLSSDDFKCCGSGDGALACADRPQIVTQCSPALRGALMAINQSQTSSCARAHNVNIGIKRRPAAEPPQVPVLITALYPAYIEATSMHRKDARWCGCSAEFDSMGLPKENKPSGKEKTISLADKDRTRGEKPASKTEPKLAMATLMQRRQQLLAQHRSLRLVPENRTVVETLPETSLLQIDEVDSRSGSFPPAIEELFARYQAVNLDVKDNEYIDTNGWPFSMRTPAPVAPADSDGTACRFSVQVLYHSGKLEFIAFCDYAWKYPLMTVIGPHGRKVQASWIEIRSSSGCGTMTGIFVLAQTGYIKLLPLVPDKFLRDEWVPFGMSDVLLGPSVGLAMNTREPVSSIDRIRIDTDGKLNLLYTDIEAQPGVVQLQLVVDRRRAQLTVQGLSWLSSSLAYIRYRSMHVKPGVSDVDTITGDDGVAMPVMYLGQEHGPRGGTSFGRQWAKVGGSSWSMRRQCVSVTDSLSPDVSISLDCSSGSELEHAVGGFGRSFRRRDASKMFTYEEKILPLPLELTQNRATGLLFLGLAVGTLGSLEYALSGIAIVWSAGFQLGAVWNPTAAATSSTSLQWFNTADPSLGVSDTRVLVPQSPLGDGILIAFDASIAAFMSLQIRDFMMGAVHSYQALKVVLGFTACAWGASTGTEPDLGILRSLWMKCFFVVCSATLGILANYNLQVRRWMPLTITSLQGANWFVTSMCWFKPWLPPIAQIAPLWDNDWRELPPGVRARLGLYFYLAVAVCSLALFTVQLALRYPGFMKFQLQQFRRIMAGKPGREPDWKSYDHHEHIERIDKWGSHVFKVLVIIGVCVANALVVMQFDWERGNWTFMIFFTAISTFLSWNIVDLSVSTLCFYALYAVVGFKPLPTRNFSHGIPDDCKTALAFCLLSGSEISSEETFENTTAAYLGNLCPNGNLKAAVVSVSNDYKVIKRELDCRDEQRENVEKVLREAYEEVKPIVLAEILADERAAKASTRSEEAVASAPPASPPAQLGEEGTAKYMWSVLLRHKWRARRKEWDELAEKTIEMQKAGLIYLHRTCRVLKKPGQYQDMMLLMARGVTGAMSYTSEYYGTHGRPAGSVNWGFHSNIHFKNAPKDSDPEELKEDLERRMAPDVEMLRVAGASGIEVPAEPGGLCRYRYCMMMDKDTVLPAGAAWRLCEVGGANKWEPGMSDDPGKGPGIISCQLQVERVRDITWFMWGNMVIEATKPSVDRCWYELVGSCGFFGKGLLDCEKYIAKCIGTPEVLVEALPVDIMSHDTPEGFLLRPCFADHVIMEEEPARNFITFESQTTRWMVGELLNLCYEHPVILRDPVNATRKFVAWTKGKEYVVPRLRPSPSTSSWGGRYMASKALREYHSGPLMLTFLFMVSFQHNVPGYLTPVSFENYTPDNVLPVMYPAFQLTMLVFFIVFIFVLPKLAFFAVGLHPRLIRRHGAKEVFVRFCFRIVYSIVDLVVCAFAFSSEVQLRPCIVGQPSNLARPRFASPWPLLRSPVLGSGTFAHGSRSSLELLHGSLRSRHCALANVVITARALA